MFLRRVFLFLVALLIAAPGFAASVADRSPFAQGHWWDPTRSGNGFDIFNAAGQVAVVWYTYDNAGRPIWYNAQGDLASLGTQAWPLWQQRWSDGHRSGQTVVGSLRLDVRHPESINVSWELRGQRGTWAIQPYIGSGVISEVDHSGHWFDPSQGGWGFTLIEQGDVLGSVLYTYDAAGDPTWLAGFGRGMAPRVELFACTGTCPACAYLPTTTRSVGLVSFNFRGEAELTVGSNLSLPMAAGVNVDGARAIQLGRPASLRAADRQLASFDSDAGLKAYLDAGMLSVPAAVSGADFSSPPPATAFSTTNLVEAGVDEADLVKSDGQRLYTYAYLNDMRQAAVRVAQVSNDGAALDMLGTVALASGNATPMGIAGLYLHSNGLISVTGPQVYSYLPSPWGVPLSWTGGATYVEVLDTSATALPVTRWRAQIDGYLVASRRIGERLYVVSRFVPYLPGFVYGASAPSAVTANQQILAATPLSGLLPQVRINGGAASPLVGTREVYVPPQGSRVPMADMILVTAVDLAAPRIAQSLAIVGSVEAVYASSTNLFVASSRQALRTASGALLPVEPSPYLTDIHQVGLGAQAMNIVASASIEGFLGTDAEKASFRLSEDQGRLRAVTSSTTLWGGVNQNRVTILEPSMLAPGLLKTVSYLPNPQRPQMLGKPYEILYSTRFVGDRLYAVTFKSIDPLYIVDLADVADPRIAGALELPGFSNYLHPLPNGLLLGFGKDTRPATAFGDGQFAWYQGLQLTLFDVRDAATLRAMQSVVMGKRGSDSALLRDHHAFSMLTQSDGLSTLAIPARIHDGPSPLYGSGDSAYYPWQESGLVRFELRGATAADALLVQMPSLLTHTVSQSSPNFNDPAVMGGRSVLFRNGTIYIGNGRFWRQDSAGIAFGPY